MKSTDIFYIIIVSNIFTANMPAVAQPIFSSPEQLSQPSLLERLDTLKRKALQEVDSFKNSDKPRQVKRASKPEIILRNNMIFINGKEIHFGDSLEYVKKTISGTVRCSGKSMTLCIWDDLGLEVGTKNLIPETMSFLNIYIRIDDSYKVLSNAGHQNAAAVETLPALMPREAFPGYLELNGVGIDVETKFSEIRTGSAENAKLHCGLLDCSHPRGPFGEKGHIYFTLDERSDNGRIRHMGLDTVE